MKFSQKFFDSLHRLYAKLDRYPKLKAQIRHLIHFPGGAAEFAWSVASGTFVGIAVPEGLQTVTSLGIVFLFKTNFIITTLFTLVTNPLTIIPIYYISYRIGEFITGTEITWQAVELVFKNPGFTSLFALGTKGAVVFLVGAVIHGAFWGVMFYGMSFRFFPYLEKLRNHYKIDHK